MSRQSKNGSEKKRRNITKAKKGYKNRLNGNHKRKTNAGPPGKKMRENDGGPQPDYDT